MLFGHRPFKAYAGAGGASFYRRTWKDRIKGGASPLGVRACKALGKHLFQAAGAIT
jgi:hypothetical protein